MISGIINTILKKKLFEVFNVPVFDRFIIFSSEYKVILFLCDKISMP